MIKLVATDLDGTLLDADKRPPANFDRAVDALYERGVRVVIASGRQYYNLLELFPKSRDKLIFLCENGAIVFDGAENIFSDAVDHRRLASPLEAIKGVPTASAVLCGVKSAYISKGADECERHAKNYYARRTVAEDILEAAKADKICKIALFDAVCSEDNLWHLRGNFGEGWQMAISGQNWLDLMNVGTHKGMAIRMLQERLNIGYHESMAFGDYLNDSEMMREVFHSYAMANSHADLKKLCRHIAPANTENGVMKVLNATFDLGFE